MEHSGSIGRTLTPQSDGESLKCMTTLYSYQLQLLGPTFVTSRMMVWSKPSTISDVARSAYKAQALTLWVNWAINGDSVQDVLISSTSNDPDNDYDNHTP